MADRDLFISIGHDLIRVVSWVSAQLDMSFDSTVLNGCLWIDGRPTDRDRVTVSVITYGPRDSRYRVQINYNFIHPADADLRLRMAALIELLRNKGVEYQTRGT